MTSFELVNEWALHTLNTEYNCAISDAHDHAALTMELQHCLFTVNAAVEALSSGTLKDLEDRPEQHQYAMMLLMQKQAKALGITFEEHCRNNDMVPPLATDNPDEMNRPLLPPGHGFINPSEKEKRFFNPLQPDYTDPM